MGFWRNLSRQTHYSIMRAGDVSSSTVNALSRGVHGGIDHDHRQWCPITTGFCIRFSIAPFQRFAGWLRRPRWPSAVPCIGYRSAGYSKNGHRNTPDVDEPLPNRLCLGDRRLRTDRLARHRRSVRGNFPLPPRVRGVPLAGPFRVRLDFAPFPTDPKTPRRWHRPSAARS